MRGFWGIDAGDGYGGFHRRGAENAENAENAEEASQRKKKGGGKKQGKPFFNLFP